MKIVIYSNYVYGAVNNMLTNILRYNILFTIK